MSRYQILAAYLGDEADTWQDAVRAAPSFCRAGIARPLIRDTLTGAIYDATGQPADIPEPQSLHAGPRTPKPGELWLHETLGEVEVIETTGVLKGDAIVATVQPTLRENRLRRSVPVDSLIGRAE